MVVSCHVKDACPVKKVTSKRLCPVWIPASENMARMDRELRGSASKETGYGLAKLSK
jgi:hypothetical protein